MITESSGKLGRNGHAAAFTLLELMVVVAVVGILSSLLLPVLAGTKAKAKALICMNNHRQLIFSCLLYAGEHEDSFPYNLGSAETRQTVAQGQYLNWVNNVMSWELDDSNTNHAPIRAGGLGPYLSGETSVFKCPSDKALSDIQRQAGWKGRTRSISMNAMVGNAGQFTIGGVNTNNPYYRQFFKLAQVPEPSRIFVFIEEHPDSINDGYFLNRARRYRKEWMDLPASYHDGAAHLAFSDGHVERHAWQSKTTQPPPHPDAADLPFAVSPDEDMDYGWLMEHTSVKTY